MARGGKRPGAGRKAGAVDGPKDYLKNLCREHAEKAVSVLVRNLASDKEDVAHRAAVELLDRGFGKATQLIGGDADAPITWAVTVKYGKDD